MNGASSTAVMLVEEELLCPSMALIRYESRFFDGEEAVKFVWHRPDNRMCSRQMAAKLAMSGELPKIKAVLLSEMVGSRNLRFRPRS